MEKHINNSRSNPYKPLDDKLITDPDMVGMWVDGTDPIYKNGSQEQRQPLYTGEITSEIKSTAIGMVISCIEDSKIDTLDDFINKINNQ